jgi:hypothetical protein
VTEAIGAGIGAKMSAKDRRKVGYWAGTFSAWMAAMARLLK